MAFYLRSEIEQRRRNRYLFPYVLSDTVGITINCRRIRERATITVGSLFVLSINISKQLLFKQCIGSATF